MAVDINGVDQFAALARTLKELGDKGLQRELNKAISDAVKPFRQSVRQSALDTLPAKGGLNRRTADRVSPRLRKRSGRAAQGVRMVATGKQGLRNLAALDEGWVRHPVFGGSADWVQQDVTPGFWSRPAEELLEPTRDKIIEAMESVAKKIDESTRR